MAGFTSRIAALKAAGQPPGLAQLVEDLADLLPLAGGTLSGDLILAGEKGVAFNDGLSSRLFSNGADTLLELLFGGFAVRAGGAEVLRVAAGLARIAGDLRVTGTAPRILLQETDQPSGQQIWTWRAHDRNMFLSRCDDAGEVLADLLNISESQVVALAQAVLSGAAVTGANKLIFGWPTPMAEMWHSGTQQYMDLKTGGFYIRANPGTADPLAFIHPTWITLYKGTTLSAGAIVADAASIRFGVTQAAAQIRAISGATLAIASLLVPFEFRSNGDAEYALRIVPDGAVEAYHNGVKRLETTSYGANIPGILHVTDTTESDTAAYLQNTHASFNGTVLTAKTDRAPSSYHTLLRCVSGTDPQLLLNGVGQLSIDGPLLQNQSDDARMWEWEDGNPAGEERLGVSVYHIPGTRLIRPATWADVADDPAGLIGITSAAPAQVANAHEFAWQGKWATDAWGRRVEEAVTVVEWTPKAPFPVSVEETFGGELPEGYAHEPPQPVSRDFERLTPEDVATLDHDAELHACARLKKNPDYDPERPYTPRSARPEWACVGMRGVVPALAGQPVRPSWRCMGERVPGVEEWLLA